MTGHTHAFIELIAAAVLVAGGALSLVHAWARRNAVDEPVPATRSAGVMQEGDADAAVARALAVVVASLSFGAALIHLAAAPHHLVELGTLGIGFPLAAALQAMWGAAWLHRRSPIVAWSGIALNTAIAIAWAVSRTAGLPAGGAPWTPERAGAPDVSATVFQVVIVVLLAVYLSGADRRIARHARDVRGAIAVALVPALGSVVLFTMLAVNVAAAGDGEGDADAAGGHDHAAAPGVVDEGHASP